MGIDTTAFREGISVPTLEIQNAGMFLPVQRFHEIGLNIIGKDQKYILDRFNVWVNGIPVYGQRGISIRKRNQLKIDTTIFITLTKDLNKIEASVFNINGTESYRMPFTLTYTGNIDEKEKLYFLGIVADQFADSSYNLRYSRKDIRDLALMLKSRYPGIIIDTLFNEQVSIENVRKMKEKLRSEEWGV